MSEQTASFGELLKFPCKITLKVIGDNSPKLEEDTLRTLREELKIQPVGKIEQGNKSSSGKYLTIKICVKVNDEAQLRSIYETLCKLDVVKHVL